MSSEDKPVVYPTVSKGDTITISHQGNTYTGKVMSASNPMLKPDGTLFPGYEPEYCIEFTDQFGNYRYWKSISDGGRILNIIPDTPEFDISKPFGQHLFICSYQSEAPEIEGYIAVIKYTGDEEIANVYYYMGTEDVRYMLDYNCPSEAEMTPHITEVMGMLYDTPMGEITWLLPKGEHE